MSYVVIARKFRPARFEDVVGQEVVTRTLRNALSLGRVAHAYLFSGTRGVGKTTTARLLAKCCNCEKGIGPEPCDSCASCREIASGGALDVLEIDGASNRGINEVRELRESARYTPARDRHKIFIIDEVHMLTSEAWNALLKILEEPPPHVIFILATTEREKVPATILSRCQKLEFRRLGTSEIEASLHATCQSLAVAIDPAAMAALATAADGSLRDAQSLLEQAIAYGGERITAADVDIVLGAIPRDLVFRALQAIFRADGAAALEAIETLYQGGLDPRLFATSLLQRYRNLILLAAGGRNEAMSQEERECLDPLASQASLPELLRSAEVLAKLDRELRFSSTPRFALELGILELAEMKRLLPLDEIIASLSSEAGAASRPPSGPEQATMGGSRTPPAPRGAPPKGGRPAEASAASTAPDGHRAFAEACRQALGLRAGFLDELSGLEASAEIVTLRVRAGSDAALEILSGRDVIEILQEVARLHYGAATVVRVLPDGPASPKQKVGGKPATDAAVARMAQEPLVKKLLDVFQGDVAAVDPAPRQQP